MLSLISVVNDPVKAQARLLTGLARQDGVHQFVEVDNRDGRFTGAAAALNWGATQAKGEWLVFLHQDVELLSPEWLSRAEAHLNRLPAVGWCGVAGRTAAGRWRGILRDRAMIFGEPFADPIEVQTLDEVLLVHRNLGPGHSYFDEAVPGWHAYGVEACCTALGQGLRNYVLPLPIWHDSNSTNLKGLREAHAYVWQKHRRAFPRIYTTCGVLPHPYGWSGSYRVAMFLQRVRGWRHAGWLRLAAPGAFRSTPWAALEELTCREPVVDCLHSPAWFEHLEGTAFTDRTTAPRRIVHHFAGFQPEELQSDCLVVAPDLAGQLTSLEQLPVGVRRLLVCCYLGDAYARPRRWGKLLGRKFSCTLAMEADETRWGILEMDLSARPAGVPGCVPALRILTR
jgi:hypothetical protein